MNGVEWRTLKEGKGKYEISSAGVVREIIGLAEVPVTVRGDGYGYVKLFDEFHALRVASYMRRAFFEEQGRYRDYYMRCRNGDQLDNRLENLELVYRGKPKGIQLRDLHRKAKSAKFGKKRSDLTKGE